MSFFKNTHSKDSRTAIVKKNALASLAIKGISIMVQLMLVPMTLGYVSSQIYGVWLTLSSIVLWMGFFDIGFTLGLKNKLTEAIALDQWQRGRELVSTTYFMMVLIFIPVFLLLCVAIPFVDWTSLLNVPAQYKRDIVRTLYILAGCFCVQMILNVICSVIASFQKTALSSLLPVLGNVLALIAIFILSKTTPPSLVVLGAVVATAPLVVLFIASVVLYAKQFNRVHPSVSCFRRSLIKDLFNLGVKFFIIQLQVVVMFQTTNVLISYVSGPEEVTNYNIAHKYIGVALMAFNIILGPLWPAITDAYTKNDFAWMKKIYKKMTKVYMLAAMGVLLMVGASPWVYKLWIGNKADIHWSMTIAVALYVIVFSWDSLQVYIINGLGKIKLQTYVTLFGLFAHVPVALFLGQVYGAKGVLMSLIAINVIYSLVFTIQTRKIINQTAKGVWLE